MAEYVKRSILMYDVFHGCTSLADELRSYSNEEGLAESMEFSNRNVAFSNILCYDIDMIEFYETTYDLASKKNADMEAILFGKEDCAPSHAYGPTLRPYHLFHFVTKGHGMLQIDGRTFELDAGDVFLIPAEQVSYYEASATDPWSYSWAGMTGLRATQYIRQIMAVVPERYVIRQLDTKKYAASIDKAATLRGTSAGNYFCSEIVLYELFSYFAADLPALSGGKHTPTLAARVKFYLDAKYTEKLRIDELAADFGVHPNHLSRAFRERYDVSPKQYLQTLKLEKAASMLTTTDTPVALIAESLGFDDQHAFSKLFKKYWGVSPMAYRKVDTRGAHR